MCSTSRAADSSHRSRAAWFCAIEVSTTSRYTAGQGQQRSENLAKYRELSNYTGFQKAEKLKSRETCLEKFSNRVAITGTERTSQKVRILMGLSHPKNPSIYISLPLRIHIHYCCLRDKNKAGDKNLPITSVTVWPKLLTSVLLVSCTISAAAEPSFVLVAPGFPSCFVYRSVLLSKLKTDHMHQIHRGTCTVYRTLQNVIQQQLSLSFPVTA